jgi:hypothetical protein
MTGLAIGAAVLVAVVAVGLRSWRRGRERVLPGRSPGSAIAIEDYTDIDVIVRGQDCECGGSFVMRGEGPVRGGDGSIRMTRLGCRRCARERVLYFDVTTVRH